MNIKGLDYNTTRERLVLPEYGREVQEMVNHAMTITDRKRRQRCAEDIINIMTNMMQRSTKDTEYKKKLWDHLALMSNFQLDIDYPVDVKQVIAAAARPQPLNYPMSKIPVRHYGKLVFEMFEKLKTMPAGKQRDELTRLTANHMKRNIMQWSHGSFDKRKVAADLAYFTDGKVQIDPEHFVFEKITLKDAPAPTKRKKK